MTDLELQNARRAVGDDWELLPISIRKQVRNDVAEMIAAGQSNAAIIAAGYPEAIARRALGDLGRST